MDHLDLSELARLRVKPSSLRECERSVQTFVDWLSHDLVLGDSEKLDDELNAFAHHIYRTRQKEGLSVVEKAKEGIEFFCPTYKDKLQKTTLSLQGWRKVVPSKAHDIAPREAAFLIARDLLKQGEADASTMILGIFDGYLRVSDVNVLKVGDVLPLPEASLRYGGATWDKIEGIMTDEEIKRRGRWVQDKTFRHYFKIASYYEKVNLIPVPKQIKARRLMEEPLKYFQGIVEQVGAEGHSHTAEIG